ncbi:MAG TPA: hypothetical protein VGB88_09620 [Alphaproteobacteria bacterium]
MPPEGRRYWLDDWRNVRKLLFAFFAVCALLILLDLLYHKHAVLAFEEWFGFYAIYGFVACMILVLASRLLRKLVGRRKDYYQGGARDDA